MVQWKLSHSNGDSSSTSSIINMGGKVSNDFYVLENSSQMFRTVWIKLIEVEALFQSKYQKSMAASSILSTCLIYLGILPKWLSFNSGWSFRYKTMSTCIPLNFHTSEMIDKIIYTTIYWMIKVRVYSVWVSCIYSVLSQGVAVIPPAKL